MKYCGKCKEIYFSDNYIKCRYCGKKLISDPSSWSPVHIITANGFELERIRAAVESADIPYSYQESKNDAGIQILNSAPPENCDVFVPLSAYNDALEVLIGIGALKENDIPDIDDENKALLEDTKKNTENEELSPQKARLIRILSAIAFLIILAGVVYLTDLFTGFIKGFF